MGSAGDAARPSGIGGMRGGLCDCVCVETLSLGMMGRELAEPAITNRQAQAKPAVAKRTMSAAARNRIAAAQRKRWAELKKAQAKKPVAKTTVKKAAAPEKTATAAT